MADRRCGEILERVALGIHREGREVRIVNDHLRDCVSCREEAGRIRSIFRELEATRETTLPVDLDARIRALVLGESPAGAARIRPGWALLLSLISGSGLSIAFVLALAGAGGPAAALGVLIPIGYLFFCCLAVLPILLSRYPQMARMEVM